MNYWISLRTQQIVILISEVIDMTPSTDNKVFVLFQFEGIQYCCDKSTFYKDFQPLARYKHNKERQETFAPNIIYPYETKEYKEYTTLSGKKFLVYKNSRVFKLLDDGGKVEVQPHCQLSGYYTVGLAGEQWLLHRLVAKVWLKAIPGKDVVDHIDNNKNNNSVDNLQWLTTTENVLKGKITNQNKL